ncbi:hypothetical protein Hanom_Chr06g00554891 [Helianthus anomalus]
MQKTASVDTYYVDATQFGSTRLVSTRIGSVRARRHDIPLSCAPKIDTRNTKRCETFPA